MLNICLFFGGLTSVFFPSSVQTQLKNKMIYALK